MELAEIKNRIEDGIPGATAVLEGDGCSCEATVISDSFDGQGLLAQQRAVMATVNDVLASGELHALSIKTYTTAQWEQVEK
ncbi:MAG: BolA/IbaG family iron-sulfur metabolism protein [Gammaproteobacteria bacterium]|uniref:BolA/IbaG family iron-sulfur metabolism protein n=1 Tax=Candidatus Thiopontia autotrophica TaxID=2841688 RepID=A0A8J6P2H0_9GAMM|nr:BolA/IbaG family iron-sulfur metabolism protein [Candidatus Thiopontia autotrophica]MBL6969215.1 BolA/IbaG family iron-sulfur metabolism protein [Gammaproteobacteria bacterium]